MCLIMFESHIILMSLFGKSMDEDYNALIHITIVIIFTVLKTLLQSGASSIIQFQFDLTFLLKKMFFLNVFYNKK